MPTGAASIKPITTTITTLIKNEREMWLSCLKIIHKIIGKCGGKYSTVFSSELDLLDWLLGILLEYKQECCLKQKIGRFMEIAYNIPKEKSS